MILIFFSTRYGSYIQEHTVQVVFSIAGIIIAQLVTILGISIRLIKAVMDEIPPRYENIARTLGATQWKAFRTVTLPLAKRGIIAAYLLAWAKAIGEFGATITVAGSMPLKTETLPTAIYLRLASADIEGSVVLILIIVSIGIFTLTIFRLLGHSKIV
ncbi:MAG: ABC transporter permease subunit [Flavobacteriaceae bacterium]|nr:ABC transporter permease subunit [Flavobacteriaceae bacterium]